MLRQVRGKPEAGDTISSYALRQAAFSRDSIEAVRDAQPASLPHHIPACPRNSGHPTIWFYFWTGVKTGVC
ncbi:hypothetical protein [Mesorhizobium delmotii]|uniref:Formyl transferase n=1 Tax=Mesorhizobium delmotii TaxID=1631247 RepID=A0A2P9AX03_9HYPH